MTWVKLDDQFFTRAKARRAGKDGRALYLAGLCFCAANLTDGVITSDDLRFIAASAEVRPVTYRKLIEVGLWEEHPDGFLVHDYHEYNLPAEQIKEERRRDRERKQAERSRGGKHRTSDRSPPGRPPGQPPESDRSPDVPSRPVPSFPLKSPPEDSSVAPPVVGEALNRITDSEVATARESGVVIASETGFRKHKFNEVRERFGDQAAKLQADDPHIGAPELVKVLTSQVYASGYHANRRRQQEAESA